MTDETVNPQNENSPERSGQPQAEKIADEVKIVESDGKIEEGQDAEAKLPAPPSAPPPVPSVIPDAAQEPYDDTAKPLAMGFSVFPIIMNATWWKAASRFVWAFRKQTLRPAILVSVGTVLPNIGYYILGTTMGSGRVINGLGDALTVVGSMIGVLLLFGLGGFGLMMWGLTISLAILTGMCRAFLTLPKHLSAALAAGPPTAETLTQLFEFQAECVKHFYHRKAYLAIVWLMYLVFTAIPSIVFLVCVFVIYTGLPASVTHMAMTVPYPPQVMIMALITCGVTTIAMMNYALVLLAYSSLTTQASTRTALRSLVLSLKILPGLSLFSAIVALAGAVLFDGTDFIVIAWPQLASSPLATYSWFFSKIVLSIAVTVVLMPFSFIIPAEMIRGHIDIDSDDAPAPTGGAVEKIS